MTENLSNKIWAEYQRLIERTESINENEFFESKFDLAGRKASLANILAYQIGWGNMLISWYENGISNIPFTMPGEGFTKWDYASIAQYFYKKYDALNCKDLKAEFLKTVTKITNIAEHEEALGRLDKIGIWDWCELRSGKKWPLSKWIRVNTIAPYKRASRVIILKI